MRLFLKVLIFVVANVPVGIVAQPTPDYIERIYYAEVEAPNHALSAARYSEEAYFYSHQANNRSDLSDYRADIDTVLFYLKKSTELANLALESIPSEDSAGVYLHRGVQLIEEADVVLRHIYPFRKLPVMQQYSEILLVNLMNAKIDFYTASLYLGGANPQLNEDGFTYEELDIDQHIARLDADESSFTDLVIALENKLILLNEKIMAARNALDEATNNEQREALQQQLNELLSERDRQDTQLQKANNRLMDIRDEQQARELQQELPHETAIGDSESVASRFETDRHGYYNENKVTVNEPLPQGLVYRIQLGYYFKTTANDAFKGLFPITGEDLNDGKIRYYAGMFTTYKEASKAKDYIREKRIGDAFVVPYLDGKKINVKRAIALEREMNTNQ